MALLVLLDSVNPARLDGLSVTQAFFVQADELCRKIWFHLRSMTRLEFADLRACFLKRPKNVWHTLTRRSVAGAGKYGILLRLVLRRDLPKHVSHGQAIPASVEEALIEMYLAGISVRRVEDITEALWGTRLSPSTV